MAAEPELGSAAEENPYVGPRPFERDDEPLFFGRRAEIRELVSHVVANRVVLLYAASGAGKTSVLNAGVLPLLEREERFEILPRARVGGGASANGAAMDAGANVFVADLLLDWQGADGHAGDPGQRLAEFLAARPEPRDERRRRLPRLIVVDQFEELFTFHTEHWEQRAGFFEQLAEALEADPYLHAVIALREEYLARLERYLELIPAPVPFRLERLEADAALSAAVGPLERTSRRFAPGVAEAVVEDLRSLPVDVSRGEPIEIDGEFVEPVHLQVVCRSLWAALPPDVEEITDAHRQAFGDVDEALGRFYSDAVTAAAAAGRLRERELRRKLEQGFITPMGTRNTVFEGDGATAEIPNAAIGELEQRHLLHGEYRGRTRWLELTHDRLIEPIRRSNQRYRETTGRRRRRRQLAAAVVAAMVAGGVAVGIVAATTSDSGGGQTIVAAPNASVVLRQRVQVVTAAYSPDGRLIVTASADGVARIWNASSGTPVATLRGGGTSLSSAAFSPDGRLVVTGDIAGGARVWDWRAGRQTAVLRHPAHVTSAAFGPDGSTVLTASADGIARLWDVDSGRVVVELRPPRRTPLFGAAFSPDGGLVVTAGADGVARVWNVASRSTLAELRSGTGAPLLSAAFSPDGRLVATGSADGAARIWSWRDQVQRDARLYASQVASASFSPDGTYVVAAVADGAARVWSPGSGALVSILRAATRAALGSAVFSPDGKQVLTASADRTARVWDLYATSGGTGGDEG
jgi:WD40 repeat protein